MRILVDTHILLWWLSDDEALSADARSRIADPANDILVSAATAWEIAIKQSLGKLVFSGDLEKELLDQGFELVPVTFGHAAALADLPDHHRDPFDRMLVAQARTENLQLLTVDQNILKYPVNAHRA